MLFAITPPEPLAHPATWISTPGWMSWSDLDAPSAPVIPVSSFSATSLNPCMPSARSMTLALAATSRTCPVITMVGSELIDAGVRDTGGRVVEGGVGPGTGTVEVAAAVGIASSTVGVDAVDVDIDAAVGRGFGAAAVGAAGTLAAQPTSKIEPTIAPRAFLRVASRFFIRMGRLNSNVNGNRPKA